MAKQPETRLQRRIRNRLQDTWPNSWWVKIHGGPFQAAGIPDLVGCVQGLFFAFEVKVPGKEPTLLQVRTIECISRAGGCSAVVYSPEEAVGLVREALRVSKARRRLHH